jgi:hypothetical protein
VTLIGIGFFIVDGVDCGLAIICIYGIGFLDRLNKCLKGYTMNRKIKYKPEDNKFLGAPKMSIMMALETAVLLMEQSGCEEEDIMKYVHMIHMGWIRNGELAPEYLELCAQVQKERYEEEAAEARVNALRASAQSSIVTDYRS